jgi:FkbM family methyltransferase
LAGNVAINNCFNVQAINAAVAEVDGLMRIPAPNYFEPASFGSLELKPLAHPEYIGQKIEYREELMTPVRTIRIDSLGLQRVDLIKIDVEGMEIEVLQGASACIGRFFPLMLIEHNKSDQAKLAQLMASWGYVLYDPGGMNWLAVHATDKVRERIVQPPTSVG